MKSGMPSFGSYARVFAFALLALALTSTTQAEPPAGASPFGRLLHSANPMNWDWPEFKAPQWKMPNFGRVLPSTGDRERIVKKKDSLVDDVSATAKKSWQTTKDVLNPMKLLPKSGEKQAKNDAESPGFFRSMFQAAPEPEARVADVTDFLSRERP